MAKKFYAVKRGRTPGIFESWAETCKQVIGFSGAIYKGFYTREDAEKFLTKSKLVSQVAPIYAVAVGKVPGLYFSWDEAKAACPGGWHLPSQADWNTLIEFVGDSATAGKILKATNT
ncbi:MAG: viroplasmin family protein, partial [Selenomonas sp.]|nr:viroplasmin family protein [Selenomonas sp.]